MEPALHIMKKLSNLLDDLFKKNLAAGFNILLEKVDRHAAIWAAEKESLGLSGYDLPLDADSDVSMEVLDHMVTSSKSNLLEKSPI